MNHVISRAAIAILAAATLAACGSNNETNNTGNNANNANNATTGNTGEETTGQTNNEDNNGTTNIGTATSPGTAQGPQDPAITVFEYYVQLDSFGNTGYRYTVASQRIANSDGYDQPVSAEDADEFVDAYLTQETIDAMLDGWGCRDAASATERTFFAARIRIDGSVTRYTQDVTGCVEDDDRSVVDIVDALDTLGAIYL